MSWIDSGILIIILIGLILGYTRGFVQSITTFIGYFAAIICAKIYSPKLASVLSNSSNISEKINEFVSNRLNTLQLPGFSVPVANVNSLEGEYNGILEQEKINELMNNFPFLNTDSVTKNINDGIANVGESISSAFVNMFYIVISALVIFIVVRIIFSFIGNVLKAILRSTSVLNSTDRLLGSALGGLTAFLIILLVSVVVTPFIFTSSNIEIAETFRESIIMAWLYKSNVFASLLTSVYSYFAA